MKNGGGEIMARPRKPLAAQQGHLLPHGGA